MNKQLPKRIHQLYQTPAYVLSLILLSLVMVGCAEKAHHEKLIAFGTEVDIKIWGVEPETGRQAVVELAKDFEYMHTRWHAWKEGTLGRTNQLLPLGEYFSVSPSIIPLIKDGTRLSALSGGRFNPAIGQLIRLWGFASDDPPKGPPPDEQAIEELLSKKPSMDDLVLEGVRMRGTNPAVRLDFGGFAKGVAVDRAIEHLREMGIHNAVVNAGGDLRAIGKHGERPWRIGIQDPRGPGRLASVYVEGDESVFTSGNYERFFVYEGVRYHHIIDPRSGYPARGTISVTVFHDNAGEADAAATALFIAGPEDWYEVAKAMGIKSVMLIDTRGVIHMTPNLRDRIYFNPDNSANAGEEGSERKLEIKYSEPL